MPWEMDMLDDALADRITNENTLSHNERYQRALLDNFPFLVWLKDTESRFLTVNRHFAEAVNAPNCEALIGPTTSTTSRPTSPCASGLTTVR